MTRTVLRGVNWGHRRATGPFPPLIARFSELHPDVAIACDVRPLSDFEHQGIADIASVYDFVVFDHPFCGDIAASGAFLPIGELVQDDRLLAPERFIGPSLRSYHYAGHLWGAPIDGATQNALYRADLLADELPASWSDVTALGARLRQKGRYLALACVTPHALLVAAALMASRGTPWSTDPTQRFVVDGPALEAAFEEIAQLLSYCPPQGLNWNSIDLHDAMVERDDIVYAPCVYGYATYGEADMRRRLSFAPFPGPDAAGTAIGGTAIAVSRSCAAPEAAAAFVRFMLSDEAQATIVPQHHGQPALLAAWNDATIDARFNGYYSATHGTMDAAWIRPRLRGYPRFQKLAGIEAHKALSGQQTIGVAVQKILELADEVGKDKS